MTQHPQTQPVESPENPGLLRRSFEAVRGLSPVVRGLPPVMGAEMAAHSAAEKAPSRREVLAAVAAGVLATGVGASVASANKASVASSSSLTETRAPQPYDPGNCMKGAVTLPNDYPAPGIVMSRNSRTHQLPNIRKAGKVLKIRNVYDNAVRLGGANPPDCGLFGGRTIKYWFVLENNKGKMKRNSDVMELTRNSNEEINQRNVSIRLYEPYTCEEGPGVRKWAIRFRETAKYGWQNEPKKTKTVTSNSGGSYYSSGNC